MRQRNLVHVSEAARKWPHADRREADHELLNATDFRADRKGIWLLGEISSVLETESYNKKNFCFCVLWTSLGPDHRGLLFFSSHLRSTIIIKTEMCTKKKKIFTCFHLKHIQIELERQRERKRWRDGEE